MKRYLLDANILAGVIKGVPWATSLIEKYNLSPSNSSIFISVVTKGEIFALALKFGWGTKKQ